MPRAKTLLCAALTLASCARHGTLGYRVGGLPAHRASATATQKIRTTTLASPAAPTTRRRRGTTLQCHNSVGDVLRAEHLDALSRLAAHLSHAAISTIQDVSIGRVTADTLELQVVSCEDDRCVSLLVPVAFPMACDVDAEDFDACVLNNVRALDATIADDREAVARRQALHETTATKTAAKFRIYEDDAKSPWSSKHAPVWWADARDDDLRRACADTRDILNSGDFEADRVRVAHKLLLTGGAGRSLPHASVLTARVDKIGPNGMLLTALDSDRAAIALEMPFGQTCDDARALQRAVLGAVAGP